MLTSVDIGGTEGAEDASPVLVSGSKEFALSVSIETGDWSAELPQGEGAAHEMAEGSSSAGDIEMG